MPGAEPSVNARFSARSGEPLRCAPTGRVPRDRRPLYIHEVASRPQSLFSATTGSTRMARAANKGGELGHGRLMSRPSAGAGAHFVRARLKKPVA